MNYAWTAIPETAIPRTENPIFQHLLDTYVSETNKVASTWKEFTDADLDYKPHERSSSVSQIMRHQLLSERRFFGEFLKTPEPAPDGVLPVTSPSRPPSSASWNSRTRASASSPPSRTPGGWRPLRSLTSSASTSGSSGAVCCTPLTTAPSSRSSSACWARTFPLPTVPPPTSPGPEPTPLTPSRPPAAARRQGYAGLH
jgi:hypothetical protein